MIQLGTVTGQSIEPNRGTDINVRMLQVELGTTAQSDPQSVEYIPLSGDDNPPITGDKVVVIGIGSAFKIAIGVRDLIVTVMNPGERKLYSRDGAGDIAAFIELLNNSDINMESPAVTTSGHVSVGTGATGTFSSGDGQVVVAQDGIIIGIQ